MYVLNLDKMSIIRTDTTTSRTEAAEVLCELLCEVVQGMFLTIAKKGYTNESQSMVLEKEWFGGGGGLTASLEFFCE